MKEYVWVVSDEKYGAQAVFKKKKDADKAIDSGKFDQSGFGCIAIKMEVR